MDMYIPTNFGKEYTDGFHNLFATIATEQDITLLPFLLKDVAGKPTLNQADGIHPTAEGHQLMANVVLNGIHDWRKEIAQSEYTDPDPRPLKYKKGAIRLPFQSHAIFK